MRPTAYSLPGAAALLLATALTPLQAADLSSAPAEPFYAPESFRTLSAVAELYGGYAWLNGDGLDDTDEDDAFPLFGGSALVDIPFASAMSLQLDLYGEGAFVEDPNGTTAVEDTYGGGLVGGAHLSWRNPDRYLFGAFGGGGKAFPEDSTGTGTGANLWFAGVEGQWYLPNMTLHGQAGYLDANQPGTTDEVLSDAWFVRGVAQFFMEGGRSMLEGDLAFASGKQDEGAASTEDLDVVSWGVRYQRQFADFGDDGTVSAFVEYEGYYFNEDAPGSDYTSHGVLVGLTIDLNKDTLLSRSQNGASRTLPNFGRWVAGAVTVD